MPEKANPVLSPKTKLPVQRKNDRKPGDPAVTSPAHTQAALDNPVSVPASDILALQRQYGNQAVHRLIQRKVTVGAADDPLEVEADRMADKVMSPSSPAAVNRAEQEEDELQTRRVDISRAPEEEDELQAKRADLLRQEDEDEIQTKRLSVQRQEDDDEIQTQRLSVQRQEDEDELQMKSLDVQRQEDEDELQTKRADVSRSPEEEEELQTKPQAKDWRDSFEAGPAVEAQLRQQAGGGSPLPGDVRGFMETRFGADFGGVRVHADGAAASLNRKLAAQAFTHGSEIYMGEGKYSPHTTDGKRLLAHELTHTLQQGGAQRKAIKRHVAAPRIQRYAKSVLTSSGYKNWDKETTTANRSGEGRTGVWFFTSPAGAVHEVVVKPNYHFIDTQQDRDTLAKDVEKQTRGGIGSKRMSETMLKGFGITTPDSRNIKPDDHEAQAIMAVATSKGDAIPDHVEMDTLAFITVMGKAEGKSVSGAAVKAFDQGAGGLWLLENQLENPLLLNKIGQLIALDAFMGNSDRVGFNFANLGNIMFNGESITAIDSDAAFRFIRGKGVISADAGITGINKLFDDPAAYADSFLNGLQLAVSQNAQHQPRVGARAQQIIDHFNNNPHFPRWRANIILGIQAGIQKLRTILASKKNRLGMKGIMSKLGDAGGNYDTLRIRQYLMDLRTKHPELTEAQVIDKLEEYRKYRETRAATAWGRKWTVKRPV
jgi:hypothetical protein